MFALFFRLTCIYISCKVEEFHVSAEEFGKGIQQDPQAVLKNELCLLQVCKMSGPHNVKHIK